VEVENILRLLRLSRDTAGFFTIQNETARFEKPFLLQPAYTTTVQQRLLKKKEHSLMFTKIGTISVPVSNQDKALDFYINKLGFEKIGDQPMSPTERWVEVAPPGGETHIVLGLRGLSGGDRTGFTGFVLHVDNIEETCQTLKERDVTITQEPSNEPWGKWAQFVDLDGNEFGIWAPPA
jgi:lactoylglutathione lyase